MNKKHFLYRFVFGVTIGVEEELDEQPSDNVVGYPSSFPIKHGILDIVSIDGSAVRLSL